MLPLSWLVLAWRDMARSGWISFAHGLALALAGGAYLFLGGNRFNPPGVIAWLGAVILWLGVYPGPALAWARAAAAALR